MAERWRPVLGFEGLYEVSDTGRVASLPRAGRPQRIILARFIDASGYYRLRLHREGRSHNRRVHTLVAEAFIGPRPSGMQVRHLDGNHLNLSPENLRWGTGSENVQDMIGHGRQRNARKTECHRGHPFTPANTRTEGGARKCRRCHADREAARRAARKGHM